jgi:hypothetical protein
LLRILGGGGLVGALGNHFLPPTLTLQQILVEVETMITIQKLISTIKTALMRRVISMEQRMKLITVGNQPLGTTQMRGSMVSAPDPYC